MAEITFPFAQNGKPTGARFTDKGCLSCPTGYSYSSDEAINVLERVTNNVLIQGWKDCEAPPFPLSKMPIKPASSQQMTGNSRVRHTAFYPDVKRTKFYDPTPNVTTYNVTRELLEKCGGDVATASLIANSNSIGCAPPRGDRGLAGKRRYYQSAFTSVKEIGPFCVTNFLDLQDFRGALEAYKRAAIKASAMSLEYEKLRRFVDMSLKNGTAVAGTTYPRFTPATYDAIPTSPGSFEWLINAIQRGLGAEIGPMEPVTVSLSPQLLKYYIQKYMRDHNIDLNSDWSAVKMQAQGFQGSFAEGGFELRSMQTGRRIIITTEWTPVYTEVYSTGASQAEWDFQDYFLTEVGDDPESDQAEGFWQTYNDAYGDAGAFAECQASPGKVLCEQILIHTGKAFEYQAFPTNPLGQSITGVETNMQNLWGSTQIQWFMGVEVDQYYLNTINAGLAGTGAPCFNNIDNTWFAGRIKTGMQLIELEPREMMSLLVAVPYTDSPIEKSEVCLPSAPPAAITVSAREAQDPELCTKLPADVTADAAPAGCMQVPARLQFALPSSGTQTVAMQFIRTGGTNGTLTVPFTITEDTATEGSGGSDHFTLANGNIVFANGEDLTTKNIVLRSQVRGTTDPAFVNATMVLDNDPEVLCDGSRTSISLCFKLYDEADATDPTDCPTGDCAAC
jgi:hypothetical protein